MTKLPISSIASPKRIKKSQSKIRRSRANGRNKGDAVEGISFSAEGTLHECSRSQVAYGSIDHRDGQYVTTTTPMPIRPAAPTKDIPSLLNEISPPSPQVETANTPESFFPLDGCGSPFVDVWDECFTPKTPENMIQSQIPLAPPTNLDIDFTWNSFQNEKLSTVKSEEESMEAITSTSAPLPRMDFNFGHPSIASSPDTAFDFNLDMETDLKFPFSNWAVQYLPSISRGPITTNQVYTDFFQPHQTGLCTEFRENNIINSNGNNSEIATLLGYSYYDQSHERDLVIQKDVTTPLIDSCYDPVEHDTTVTEIFPSAQAACPGKNPRKRSSSGDDGNDRREDSSVISCGRMPREKRDGRLLACPFHKKDPQRHQDCGKYTLRRIKDVKQHIYRLHCKPELYCSRCFESFKCSNERDRHIREGGCTLRAVPNHDGTISDEQRKELKECKSRGTSKQQQWMELWDVIFPGVKPPRSPHIESGQAELLSSLRTYWDSNAEEIIARSIVKNDQESMNPIRIKEVIDVVLDQFETDRTSWDLTIDGERGGAPQPPPFEDILSHLMLLD